MKTQRIAVRLALPAVVLAAICLLGRSVPLGNVGASLIGGVEFPKGASSFADAAVRFTPPEGIDASNPLWQNPLDALGVPNYTPPTGPLHNLDQFISLGNGGELVLQFIDNALTGSNSPALDLWIFEVGPEVEAMSVDISQDGLTWFSVGAIGGATSGVDIDAYLPGYGFDWFDTFGYVRLTDDVGQWPDSNPYGFWAGADIDALGAISSAPVPEPATITLLLIGGVSLAARRVRRRRNAF